MSSEPVIRVEVEGYDEVWRVECGGAIAFVAVHALIRGRAFGGIRIRPYPVEEDALADALALARTMSRKAVMAGIPGGGAKAVLIEPAADRAAAVADLGKFVESLGGRYHCGGDLGFTEADDAVLRGATRFVACGDLGAWTARSVRAAMEIACKPRVVALMGLGAVGMPLARDLEHDGVRVAASDIRPFECFERVPPEEILDVDCDVFAPCAGGGVIDADAVERLRCSVVCGGANNPLSADRDADALHERGIVYVPDFLANAGAMVRGALVSLGRGDLVEAHMGALARRTGDVLDRARAEGRSPHRVAIEEADRLLAEAG